jgi:hypothetical protein
MSVESEIDFLWEYFDEQTSEEGKAIFQLLDVYDQSNQEECTSELELRILNYLKNRFDVDYEGRPNREMSLANGITFERDLAYWKPLYLGEKSAGLLDKEEE